LIDVDDLPQSTHRTSVSASICLRFERSASIAPSHAFIVEEPTPARDLVAAAAAVRRRADVRFHKRTATPATS
jgi:hypothetical protein